MFCSPNVNSTGLLHQGVYKYHPPHPRYYSGQACSTSYLAASIPVNASTLSSGSVLSFEHPSFVKAQRPMENFYLNISDFENEFIRQTGATHLQFTNPAPATGNDTAVDGFLSMFEGPALLLANGNNYSVDGLMRTDPARLAQRAAIIKQRFLGEVLLSHFSVLIDENNMSPLQSLITEQRSRLVVDLAIGITLGLVFCLLAGAASSLAFLVTLRRRPLQLVQDPQKSFAAALSLNDSNSSICFKNLDRASSTVLTTTLEDQTFAIRNGRLLQTENDSGASSPKIKTSSSFVTKCVWFSRRKRTSTIRILDWRPFNLKRRSGALLLVFLMGVVAALLAIYCVSRERPLYQSAFIYRSDFRVGNVRVTALAPYSIIPTLVAIGIKLWWATVDSAHRRLAPFLAMSRSSTPKASGGAALSYITTPIFLITLSAVRNGHWLLALVTFGTLTSEVLQVSMSALWERKPAVLEVAVNLSSRLELRSIPLSFQVVEELSSTRNEQRIAYPNVARHLYGGKLYQTSWIYGSLAESAYGASPPAWSKDGWNFPPVDFTGILDAVPKLPTFNHKNMAEPTLNVTFDSEGIRGRVECIPIDNSSQWVSEVRNLNSIPLHDFHSNESRSRISSGFEFTPEVRMVDLPRSNGAQPETVAVGQWLHSRYSSSYDRGDPLYKPTNSENFTVLWINASYPYRYSRNLSDNPAQQVSSLTSNAPPRLIFAEKPQIQALNCQPIFETSKFRIKINTGNNKVEDYTLLGPVNQAAGAWTDGFTKHINNKTAQSGHFDVMNYNMTVR